MSVPEKIPLSELSRGDLEALTERLPLRANDDETQVPQKFRLEGVGELSRGHAQ